MTSLATSMPRAQTVSPEGHHDRRDQGESTLSTIPSQTTEEPSPAFSVLDTPVLIAEDRQFTKDTRSYEQNRQRLKNAMSLVKRRALKDRKAKATATAAPIPSAGKKDKRLTLDDVDPLRDVKAPEIESPTTRDHGSLSLRTAVFMGEVTLIDLITARKPRKPKDGDFEVIPRVRSVIALDEYIELDSELDEPWEHIYVEEKRAIRKPTYAEVVSFTK